MKKIILLFVLHTHLFTFANALEINVKEELSQLEKALSERPSIEAKKCARIDSLSRVAAIGSSPYDTYRDLYEEYRSYNYDTALFYVRMMEQEATPKQMAEVQLSRAFVYLSGGLFKEAADILSDWESQDSALLLSYY
ncbi:MAG: hypothetical protein IJ554_02855, partial [Paludibacteraceae bacterium]|nr:hypothetical protein [Paludibacteraceae bacterium]